MVSVRYFASASRLITVILQAQADFTITSDSELKKQARQALQSPKRCGRIALVASPVYHCKLLKYIEIYRKQGAFRTLAESF